MNGATSGELAATTSKLPADSSTTTSGIKYQWPRPTNEAKSSAIVPSRRQSLNRMKPSSPATNTNATKAA